MMTINKLYFRFGDCSKYSFRIVCSVLLFMFLFCNNAYAVDEEFLKYCLSSTFEDKYSLLDCWSCDIIRILIRSLMDLTEKIFGIIRDLSILILQLGGAIWLALYLLKSLGSLAVQDPAKIMDGMLMFMFKWAFVYAVIFAGLDVVMEYIVNPLLSIGFDIGMDIAKASTISMILGAGL